MIYFAIIIILIILTYHYDYLKKSNYRLSWLFFCAVVLILLSGLRYRLGTDTITYANLYKDQPNLLEYFSFDFENERFGMGYLFLNAIARTISSEFWVMQLIHAIFVNGIIIYFLYKNTNNVFFAILIYFLTAYMKFNIEVMRESCAVAVFLLSWKYFLNSDWLKYYIICFIATLFHTGATITFILPFFYLPWIRSFFTFSYKFIIMLGIIILISGFIMNNFFFIISHLNINIVQEYAEIYQYSTANDIFELNYKGVIFSIIKNLIYFLIAGVILTKFKTINASHYKSKNYFIKLEFMMCWFVIIMLASMIIKILERFSNYFTIFCIIGFADILFAKIQYHKKLYNFSLKTWVIFLMPYFISIPIGYNQPDGDTGESYLIRFYPYSSILFPEKNPSREFIYVYYQKE